MRGHECQRLGRRVTSNEAEALPPSLRAELPSFFPFFFTEFRDVYGSDVSFLFADVTTAGTCVCADVFLWPCFVFFDICDDGDYFFLFWSLLFLV